MLLQPRIGILLSTLFFTLAHMSYDAPFMLVGITVLSLFFAFLVRWRRSVIAAIVAHAGFDLIQLLILVPLVLDRLPDMTEALEEVAWVADAARVGILGLLS